MQIKADVFLRLMDTWAQAGWTLQGVAETYGYSTQR